MEWSGHEGFSEEFRDPLIEHPESEVAHMKRVEPQTTGETLIPGLVPQ